MKFWQKTFLSVFLLFAIIFNGSMYVIIHQNYQEELKHVKERGASEQYFISTSIAQNFAELAAKEELSASTIRESFQTYQEYYKEQGIYLELWKEDELFCDSGQEISGNRAEIAVTAKEQKSVIRKVKNKSFIYLSGCLVSPYESYKVIISMPIDNVLEARQQLIHLLLMIDFVAMILLAVSLFIMVKHLLRPLQQLIDATKEVANGNYSYRRKKEGKDEFAILSRSFDQMSESIEKNVKALEVENETKKQLIDNMAHELRTPLTAVLGYAEYLKMAKVPEEEKIEVLDNTISEIKRLSKLSNTLLSLAAIREEKITYDSIKVDELIERIRYIFERRAQEKQVTITYENGLNYLRGNQEMLEMLLTNLIENAMRAVSNGGHILVTFADKDHPFLQVEDDGIGMKREDLEKIQQPFYRVDKARSRKVGGVGLGVTLCTQIVKYHQASIHYDSVLGKGTIVRCDFTT
ncbi:phosphate regulon sensor protein PhoR [Lachnospiraceae bacterium KM106-2]|nr:phosphate regulon sensor protein PhoR [Lachnospiraceae bacterium KM106-2]